MADNFERLINMKNNYFQIKHLKNILFFGTSKIFDSFIEVNNKFNLNSEIITSKDQSKNISKNIKFKVINKIDRKFKNYILKNIHLKILLFFLLGQDGFLKKILLNFVRVI